MRRISSNSINNSAPFVVYDVEEDMSSKCCVCFMSQGRLINPCRCDMKYHQTCLLRYIKQKLKNMKHQLNFSHLKCIKCKQQLKFLYYENTHYSCNYFCSRFRRNWCNGNLIVMILLTVAIIAVGVILSQHSPEQGMIYYGMLIGQTILVLILLAVSIVFVQTNLTYKQIILVKVFEFVQIMRNNTSSSDDSPHHHIASEAFQITIDQQY